MKSTHQALKRTQTFFNAFKITPPYHVNTGGYLGQMLRYFNEFGGYLGQMLHYFNEFGDEYLGQMLHYFNEFGDGYLGQMLHYFNEFGGVHYWNCRAVMRSDSVYL